MPNHFHMLVTTEDITHLSKFCHRLLTAYAMYFNRRYGRVGHLFQNRFQTKPIVDESYYSALIRYIRKNPEGLPRNSRGEYPWVSKMKANTLKDCP